MICIKNITLYVKKIVELFKIQNHVVLYMEYTFLKKKKTVKK